MIKIIIQADPYQFYNSMNIKNLETTWKMEFNISNAIFIDDFTVTPKSHLYLLPLMWSKANKYKSYNNF